MKRSFDDVDDIGGSGCDQKKPKMEVATYTSSALEDAFARMYNSTGVLICSYLSLAEIGALSSTCSTMASPFREPSLFQILRVHPYKTLLSDTVTYEEIDRLMLHNLRRKTYSYTMQLQHWYSRDDLDDFSTQAIFELVVGPSTVHFSFNSSSRLLQVARTIRKLQIDAYFSQWVSSSWIEINLDLAERILGDVDLERMEPQKLGARKLGVICAYLVGSRLYGCSIPAMLLWFENEWSEKGFGERLQEWLCTGCPNTDIPTKFTEAARAVTDSSEERKCVVHLTAAASVVNV